MGRAALAWIAFTVGLHERIDDVVAAFERAAKRRRAQREAARRLAANLHAWRLRMEASYLEDRDA